MPLGCVLRKTLLFLHCLKDAGCCVLMGKICVCLVLTRKPDKFSFAQGRDLRDSLVLNDCINHKFECGALSVCAGFCQDLL